MKKKPSVSTVVDLALGKLSPEDSLRVLEFVEHDPSASSLLDDAILLSAVNPEGEERMAPQKDGIRSVSWGRWALVAACLAVMVGGGAWVRATYPPTSDLAREVLISREAVQGLVRDGGDDEHMLVYQLLAEGKEHDALRVLEWRVEAFPAASDAAQDHVLAGLVSLRLADYRVLGLYRSVDEEAVKRALSHFRAVGRLDREVAAEAHWYAACAYVMLGDRASAEGQLALMEECTGKNSRSAWLRTLLQQAE